MADLTISLPHGSRAMNPNGQHGRWQTAWAAKKRAKEMAYLQTRKVMGRDSFRPATYAVEWVYKGVKPDADNCIARCKAYLDGCAMAFGVNDRDLECTGIRRVHSLGEDAGTVKLIFSE